MSRQKPRWAAMLADERKKAGYTSESLALALGLSASTVRRAESGYECPGVMKKLHLTLPAQAQAIIEEYDAYWHSRGRRRASALVHESDAARGANEQRWLGVVKPNGRTRTYTSIDDVALKIVGRTVTADFTRLFPLRQDRGRTWTARGRVSSNGELRMLFDPSGRNRREYDSSGCFLFVPRHLESTRLAYYKGLEIRGSEALGGREPDARECDLYPPDQLPSEYMPAFAMLDLDNTLFAGWSVMKWVENSLHLHGLDGLGELRRSITAHHGEYIDGNIEHDEFAVRASAAYTEFFELNEPTAVRQAASAFAGALATRSSFHPFAADLVQALRQRLIAPVMITGAPQELAYELAAVIGITEVYGFDLSHPEQVNPGTAEGKAQIVRILSSETERSLQFAAGDEESDALVLAASPNRLLASKLAKSRPDLKNGGQVLEFDKDTSADVVISWANTVLPDPMAPLDPPIHTL